MSTENVKAAFRAVFGGTGDSRFTRHTIRTVTAGAVYASRDGGNLPRLFQRFNYEPSGNTFMFGLPTEVSEAVVTAAEAAQGDKRSVAFSVAAAPGKQRPRGAFNVCEEGGR